MSKTLIRRRSLTAALAVLALAPAAAVAQAPLPEASALVQRYVEAIGGRDAILRPQASRSVGSFEMPAAGLRGEMEVVTQAPNRMVSKVTIPGLGEIRNGFDGTVGWELNPMTGARLLSGAELDALREGTHALAAVRDASLFRSMQTVERREVDGKSCYRVKLVWQSGRETYDCYDAETGLLIATEAQQESPMGTIQVTTRMTDFREFGGVKMPTRMVQEMMGMQQVMTISSVELTGVDTSIIDPPAEIRALVGAGS
jgi:hypothetical protein